MKTTRKKHSAAFKTKVVLEALKERQTMSELAQKYELHPTQIAVWKKEFLQNAEIVFSGPKIPDPSRETDELYKKIGQLKVENDWLKKKVL